MVSLQAQSVAPDAVANGQGSANGQSQSNTNTNTNPSSHPLTLDRTVEGLDLEAVNTGLDGSSSQEIVAWAGTTFGEGLVLSTSFGIQS
ncbi:MAG: hypothetical protein VKK80_16090, partial [Prochlorothrix sp.]|nr:hypothetical protein [Prochlorothrix sp.]